MTTPSKNLKIEIYRIIDSFLVEAKDKNGNERSIGRLNEDRHLAAEAFLSLFESEKQGWVEEVEQLREDKPHVSPPESDYYMDSLAQFNRVAGVNNTIDTIITKLKE